MRYRAGARDWKRMGAIAAWMACSALNLFPLGAMAQSCTPPPGQIVGWWRAESNAVNVVTSLAASNVGNATYTNGFVGRAFSFDGSGDYYNAGTSSAFRVQNFTIEAWVRRYDTAQASFSAGGGLLCSYGQDGYGFGVLDDGSLFLSVIGSSAVVSAVPHITDTNWHHLAVSKTNTALVFYTDGVVVETNTYSATFAFNTSLGIGARPDSAANSFLGAIDEPSIYTRALVPAEIAAIYAAAGQGKCTNAAPAITVQPVDLTVTNGGSALFTVLAAGTPTLTFRWQFLGSNITGATSYILSLTNMHANNSGDYRVIVTNSFGSITSSMAVLAVLAPPVIASQPASITNFVGETNSFTVGVSGPAPLAYQWRFNGVNISNGTNSSLTLENIQTNQAGSYVAVVSNLYGSVTSAPAQLVIKFPPVITTQPLSQTVTLGADVSLSVVASGSLPLTYYWMQDAALVSVSTNATLALGNVQTNASGVYSVLVSNLYGVALSSNAVLTVTNVPCFAPPLGMVAWWKAEGNTAELVNNTLGSVLGNTTYVPGRVGQAFSFDGTGDTMVAGTNVNWRLQDFTIEAWIKRASPTQSSTSANNAELIGYGNGGYGFGLMDDGRLFLTKIDISIIYSVLTVTDTNWHHVAVTKEGPTVIMYLDGTGNAAGAYGDTFSFGTALGVGGRGDNQANSFYGRIDEAAIYSRPLAGAEILSIFNAGASGKCFTPVPAGIATQPQSQTAPFLASVSLSVQGSGTLPLYYQWYLGGTNIAAATNTTLSVFTGQSTNLGPYSVLVSNAYGSVLSSNAYVTPTNPVCVTPPSGLVFWWRGDGGPYEVVSNVAGTVMGNAVPTNGFVGQAYSFDGNGDAIRFGLTPAAQGANFTTEAWIRRAVTNKSSLTDSSGLIVAYGQAGYGMGIFDDGSLYVTAVGVNYVASSLKVTDTNWHHVAVTRQGFATVYYLDGVGVADNSYTATFSFGTPLSVGARGDTLANSFLGSIDEASVYNRALSAQEIQNVYLSATAGKCYVPAPPSISQQPTNRVAPIGTNVTFTVTATGTLPLGYQWQYGGVDISGATTSSLSLTNVQLASSGNYLVVITNPAGVTTSSVAILTVIDPPVITIQPVSIANFPGETNSFTVGVSGSAPFAYQWRFNGTNLAGATQYVLALNNIQTNDAGSYVVVVTNVYGAATSAPATLAIKYLPLILAQPQGAVLPAGFNLKLSVTATGSTPLTYFWKFNSTNILVGTNTDLSLVNIQTTNTGVYTVLVSNLYGTTLSSNALVTVTNPVCVPAPSGIVAWFKGDGSTYDSVGNFNGTLAGNATYGPGKVGQAFVFDGNTDGVLVGNLPALQVQNLTIEAWMKRADPIKSCLTGNDGVIACYGTAGYGLGMLDDGSLFLVGVSVFAVQSTQKVTDTNWHHVAVTKFGTNTVFYIDGVGVQGGPFTSSFTFTTPLGIGARGDTFADCLWGSVDEATIYNRQLNPDEVLGIYNASSAGKCFPVPPFILTQPTNRLVAVGNSNSFSVVAGGTQPLGYQWQFGGLNIPGATNTVLNLAGIQISNAGNYQVVITNLGGALTSTVAVLTVVDPPVIVAQPQSITNFIGDTNFFAVGVSGGMPLAYQWRQNGTNISNATDSSLVLENLQPANAGSYSVAITNIYGSVTSSAAVLVMRVPPVITAQPQDRVLPVGANATFAVAAASSFPFTYQWLFGSMPLPGATRSSLVLTNVLQTNVGAYSVFVSNTYGPTFSANAMLVVTNPTCITPPSGLIGWWQAQGSTADAMTGLTGSFGGNATYGPGFVGQGFVFDGTGDAMIAGTNTAWRLQDFTIEAWVKRGNATKSSNAANNAELVSFGSGGFGLGMLDDGTLFLTRLDNSIVNSTLQVTDTAWHHVAVTKQGTTVVMYLDGVGVPTSAYSVTFTFTTPLGIGGRGDTAGNSFLGNIDEVALYYRPLASNEVQTLYYSTMAGKCLLPPAWLTQPTNQTVSLSSNTVFSARASGSRPLGYQWYLNGATLPGATNSTLNVTNVGYYQVGSYNIVASNSVGSATSSNAALTLRLPPYLRNGSFETGTFTNWTLLDIAQPLTPLAVRAAGYNSGFGFFSAAPTDGSSALTTGFDGGGPGRIRAALDVTLPPGPVTLTFNWRAGWDMLTYIGATLPRTFTVVIEPYGGGTGMQTNVILSAAPDTANYDTGNQTNSVDLSAFGGQPVRICFDLNIPEYFAGPGFFQLDNVSLSYIPAPTLAIKRSSHSVVLTWPAYFTNFGPLSSPGLDATNIWSALDTNAIVRGPTNSSLTQPIGIENLYYRLKSP